MLALNWPLLVAVEAHSLLAAQLAPKTTHTCVYVCGCSVLSVYMCVKMLTVDCSVSIACCHTSPSLPQSSFCSVVVAAGNESHSSLDANTQIHHSQLLFNNNERGLPLFGAAGPCVVL